MSIMSIVIGSVILLSIPLFYLSAQLRALARWQGLSRLAAAMPLLAWLAWGGLIARDIAFDPTAHNLFPLEILIGATLALIWLGLLAALRWLTARAV
jgi:hypothetical protein